MKQRYRPQAKECNGWETDTDAEKDDEDPEQPENEVPGEDPEKPEEDDKEAEDVEQPMENGMPTIKHIIALFSQLDTLTRAVDQEIAQQPSIKMVKVVKTRGVNAETPSVKKILLDGGASHDVYHSRTIPKGVVEKEVEFVHGLRRGYVKGDHITFVEKDTTDKEAQIPKILSLGRLIKQGAKMQWNENVAELTLPTGAKHRVEVISNCPYVDLETVSAIKELKRDLERRKARYHLVGLYKALELRIKTQKQLDEHRRQGHLQYSPDCPECKRGAAKQRAHEILFTRQ